MIRLRIAKSIKIKAGQKSLYPGRAFLYPFRVDGILSYLK